MGTIIKCAVYLEAYEVGEHCGDNADFMAGILNNLGEDIDHSHTWLREFAAALDGQGEAVLRAMVARLDAIDATSTEGR